VWVFQERHSCTLNFPIEEGDFTLGAFFGLRSESIFFPRCLSLHLPIAFPPRLFFPCPLTNLGPNGHPLARNFPFSSPLPPPPRIALPFSSQITPIPPFPTAKVRSFFPLHISKGDWPRSSLSPNSQLSPQKPAACGPPFFPKFSLARISSFPPGSNHLPFSETCPPHLFVRNPAVSRILFFVP